MMKNGELHETWSSPYDSFVDYKIYISRLWLLGRLFQFKERERMETGNINTPNFI